MSATSIKSDERGFGLFTLIMIGLMVWGIWVVFSSISSSDQSNERSEANVVEDDRDESSETAIQQISLRGKNNFAASGNATRSYNRVDGFELIVSAVLPSLPTEVHYEGYYKGNQGTIRLGRLEREVSTYKAEYTSFADQRTGYDTIEIKVEGAEGTVEGIAVPFVAAEGKFQPQ